MIQLHPTTRMKISLLTAVAGIAILALHLPEAAGKGPMHKPKPTPTPEKINASGAKITKVGGDSIMIEYSKTSTSYKMTGETQITIDGKRAGSADLRAGMHVETGASTLNPSLLLSIRATTDPKH